MEVTRMLKTFSVGCAVLAVSATAALAAPAKKPPKQGPGCKPQVSVILKGTVATAAVPAAAQNTIVDRYTAQAVVRCHPAVARMTMGNTVQAKLPIVIDRTRPSAKLPMRRPARD